MALDIWFGQFNTVNGAVQEEGPYVGVFEGSTDEPDGVAVYVLVEPCGTATADLCAATVEVIARGFGDPRQPLTANLLRALNTANTYVHRHHPGETDPWFGVGVSVLALRRTEAYLAQSGPALACVRTGGAARVIEPFGDAAVRPLGNAPRMTPSFSRLQLNPGDSALLLFSEGAQLVDSRRLPALVSQAPEHALPEVYLRSRGALDFAALYLAVVKEGGIRRSEPAAAAVGGRSGQSAAPDLGEGGLGTPDPDLAVDADASGYEQRNGHGGTVAGTVRTITPRRTSLGSMTATPNPFTRKRLAWAGGIAGVGLLLLLVLPGLARQGKSEKFNQLVRGADEAVAAAEKETDLARRRALLAKAQATIDEARTLRDVAPSELAGLDQRLADQLAQLNNRRDLADLVTVADLAAPGLAAPAASQIALGPMIYLLDAAAGKVMAIPRQGEPRPVTAFEEGRPAGPNRTGRARLMTWWPAEGNRPGALLVLDDQRRLYRVDAGGDIVPVALGSTEQWRADTGLAVGTGYLYVLDTGANQIWRYALSANGFPGAPEPLLDGRVSLRDAAGISLVGGPVIATTDGRLLRITDGREQPLEPQALDRPLLAPSPPILYPADGLLYLADRGNQRIVRLSPQGEFRGQLAHVRLAGLQAIALDEVEGTLYAIAGQSLVRASIPK